MFEQDNASGSTARFPYLNGSLPTMKEDSNESWTTSSVQIKCEEVDLLDIKEECENVFNSECEEAMFSSGLVRTKRGKNCAYISIDNIVNLFENYEMICLKKKKVSLCNFSRLVECPACLREYKNSPDRLIRLYNHIKIYHQKNKEFLLKDILNMYYPLVKFMGEELTLSFSESIKKKHQNSKSLVINRPSTAMLKICTNT